MPPEISRLSALSVRLIRLAYVSQTIFRVKLTRAYFSSFVAVAPWGPCSARSLSYLRNMSGNRFTSAQFVLCIAHKTPQKEHCHRDN